MSLWQQYLQLSWPKTKLKWKLLSINSHSSNLLSTKNFAPSLIGLRPDGSVREVSGLRPPGTACRNRGDMARAGILSRSEQLYFNSAQCMTFKKPALLWKLVHPSCLSSCFSPEWAKVKSLSCWPTSGIKILAKRWEVFVYKGFEKCVSMCGSVWLRVGGGLGLVQRVGREGKADSKCMNTSIGFGSSFSSREAEHAGPDDPIQPDNCIDFRQSYCQ